MEKWKKLEEDKKLYPEFQIQREMETQGEHGNDFINDYTEVLTTDSVIGGPTGLEGSPSDMNENFTNTDNQMTMEMNTEHSIAGAEISTHQDTNL